ncbi:Scm-like with four MBT domains protein 1 [Heterocephalus glaber]|uniref:Scm-like with four MBT domains protein 1 n=1 Tax=Heterocephalus glaber TaxID=10181 RepID=G5BWU3_HETGA|nr:Scm-like with four MBT domains protein 1 [Heterocephalus glaber]
MMAMGRIREQTSGVTFERLSSTPLDGVSRIRRPLKTQKPSEILSDWDAFLWEALTGALENIGGWLKLHYEGLESPDNFEHQLYYLDPFLHRFGWAAQQGYELQPPVAIRDLKNETEWQEILAKVKEEEEEPLPSYLFKDKQVIGIHTFSVNMKLEAVYPWSPFEISPAMVFKVFDEKYFLAEMDNLHPEGHEQQSFVCHANSPGIFPVQWTLKNGIHVSPPPGYPGQDFDWADYLKQCGAEAAPQWCFPPSVSEHEFKGNMKLEAVNPLFPEEVCITTITAVRDPYLWLQLEGSKKPVPECILREVLSLLINAAYKPSHVLHKLQLDKDSVCHSCGEVLKAKYKGKSYWATDEIMKTADWVTEFCQQTCIQLECCPNLFGPQVVLDTCSENSSVLTKTKYNAREDLEYSQQKRNAQYYGKKKNKRIGRPPGGHSNLACALKKASKRRKRQKNVFVHKKKGSSASVDNIPVGSPKGSGDEDEDDVDEGYDDSLSEGSTSEQQDELQEESEMSEKKSCSSSPTQSEMSSSLLPD